MNRFIGTRAMIGLLLVTGVVCRGLSFKEASTRHTSPGLNTVPSSHELLTSASRSLLQGCPESCRNCNRTTLTCVRCNPPFVPSADGKTCVCPAGRSLSNGKCISCPKNFFCDQSSRTARRCPNALITRDRGARSIRDCVNDKGYYYKAAGTRQQPPGRRTEASRLSMRSPVPASSSSADASIDAATSLPAALPCPPDTYSTGLSYEPACTPCPEGLRTDPEAPAGSLTSEAVCMAPPGTYIDKDTNTATPCDFGTFSDSYGRETYCTRCMDAVGPTGVPLGPGITTAAAGAISAAECRVLEPGFALVDDKGLTILGALTADQVFTRAMPCPQRYYCPGGDASSEGAPQLCPRGMWTEIEDMPKGEDDEEMIPNAVSADACVAPPGWMVPEGVGDIVECPTGTYKEGWNRDSTCTPCGGGLWLSEPTETLVALDPSTGKPTQLGARGSQKSCYIQRGMGVVDGAAVICPPNTYGSALEKRYGNNPDRVQPCNSCLDGLITTGNAYKATEYNDANGAAVQIKETDGGYFSVLACATQPGYAYAPYDGGAAECEVGTWSAGGNLLPCQRCPAGSTTPSTGATSAAGCTLHEAGWGTGPQGISQRCQEGTYSDGALSVGQSCKQCPAGTTTYETGCTSVEDCLPA